jgi:hypothetical protein
VPVDELATVFDLDGDKSVAHVLIIFTKDRHSRELRPRVDTNVYSAYL